MTADLFFSCPLNIKCAKDCFARYLSGELNPLQSFFEVSILLFSLQIVGLNTNINFLTSLCEQKHFKQGNVHTDFIKVLLDGQIHSEKFMLLDKPAIKLLCTETLLFQIH